MITHEEHCGSFSFAVFLTECGKSHPKDLFGLMTQLQVVHKTRRNLPTELQSSHGRLISTNEGFALSPD